VREECLAVRDAAGILDLPGFSRFRIEGAGARDWLSTLITGVVPKPGRIGLGYFADAQGRIVSEMSIMAMGEDFFFLITAATAQWHDYEWLVKHLPDGAGIKIEDVTEHFSCQILSGPKSREILSGITDADLGKPWLTHQSARVAGIWCQLVRVSFAGELGWEIHTKVGDTPAVFDAVMRAGGSHGLRPFGMFALNSLRLEKGYRAWKGDLSTDYTVLQGGLDRFVKWDKAEFIGKRALETERQHGVSKRFVTLVIEAGDCDAPYMSTLWHDGDVVGETTSGGWGHRIGKSVALGMLRNDLTVPGTKLEVEIFGERFSATVQDDRPLWDPDNERLRA
jgi:dimethylglycine dehydrogenase